MDAPLPPGRWHLRRTTEAQFAAAMAQWQAQGYTLHVVAGAPDLADVQAVVMHADRRIVILEPPDAPQRHRRA